MTYEPAPAGLALSTGGVVSVRGFLEFSRGGVREGAVHAKFDFREVPEGQQALALQVLLAARTRLLLPPEGAGAPELPPEGKSPSAGAWARLRRRLWPF